MRHDHYVNCERDLLEYHTARDAMKHLDATDKDSGAPAVALKFLIGLLLTRGETIDGLIDKIRAIHQRWLLDHN